MAFSRIVTTEETFVISVRGIDFGEHAGKRSLVYIDNQLVAATGVYAASNELASTWKMTRTLPGSDWWTNVNYDDSAWINADYYHPQCISSAWETYCDQAYATDPIKPLPVWYQNCVENLGSYPTTASYVYFRLKISTASCPDGKIMPMTGCHTCISGNIVAFPSGCSKWCANGNIADSTRSNCPLCADGTEAKTDRSNCPMYLFTDHRCMDGAEALPNASNCQR